MATLLLGCASEAKLEIDAICLDMKPISISVRDTPETIRQVHRWNERWHSIRNGAKEEMSNEIRERTLEQIAKGDEIDKEIGGLSDGDVIARMRERGEVRD